MFGLAHRAVLLAPAEDAFDLPKDGCRLAIALVLRGVSVDGYIMMLAGCGWTCRFASRALLCCMARRPGDTVSRAIGFILRPP